MEQYDFKAELDRAFAHTAKTAPEWMPEIPTLESIEVPRVTLVYPDGSVRKTT
jgi:hypothetical protein